MHGEDDAKDVLQDAFVKIFKNIASYKSDGSFEGWMKRIVINTALTALKSRKSFTEDIENVALQSINSDELVLRDLLSLLNYLPEKRKTIFNLYEIEGYKHKEIAELLHITESTSRAELSKAKVALQSLHQKLNRVSEPIT